MLNVVFYGAMFFAFISSLVAFIVTIDLDFLLIMWIVIITIQMEKKQ